MRTIQLYNQDKNHTFSAMCCQRFEAIKLVSNKRAPTAKSTLCNPAMKNPKHAAVLAENGIDYENPSTPLEIAKNRAERLAKEKMRNAAVSLFQTLI